MTDTKNHKQQSASDIFLKQEDFDDNMGREIQKFLITDKTGLGLFKRVCSIGYVCNDRRYLFDIICILATKFPKYFKDVSNATVFMLSDRVAPTMVLFQGIMWYGERALKTIHQVSREFKKFCDQKTNGEKIKK